MKPSILRTHLVALLGAAQLFIAPRLQAAGPAYFVGFDGVNDYVRASIPTALSSNYTFSAWVYIQSASTNYEPAAAVLSGECGSTTEVMVRTLGTNHFIELGRCNHFSGTLSTNDVPLQQWVHLAVTVSAGRQVAYFINGRPAGTWDASGLDVTIASSFRLGDNLTRKFHGRLGDVRLWKSSLTRTQIIASMNDRGHVATNHLVLRHRFAEACGEDLVNSAPIPNPQFGYLDNGATRLSSPPAIPPTATTTPAILHSNSVVTLSGRFTALGAPASGWLEFGTSTNYGNSSEESAFAGTAQPFDARVAGLTPGVTYHFRAMIISCEGTNYSADRTFVAPARDAINMDFTVTTLADSGPGSLREAVLQANALRDSHTITFAANLSGQTLRLTSGELFLGSTLTIDASALPGGIRIDGNQGGRVFRVGGDETVVLDSLTITNGSKDGDGGGIYNDGTLTLNRCTVSGNAADVGGGIYHSFLAALTLNRCTVSGNSAQSEGGGIYNDEGATLRLNQSTVSGNSANVGGGIYIFRTAVTLNQSTVSGNSAQPLGGGIYNGYFANLTLFNSIVAGNSADADANILSYGSYDLQGFNLTSGDPKLAPLGNYGGPTQTRPPLLMSPAIDAGDIDTEFTTDQRGFLRFFGNAPDLGAVESSLPCLRAYYSFDNRTAIDETGNSTATYAGGCAAQWNGDHFGRADSAAVNNPGCQDYYLIQTSADYGHANSDLGLKGSFTVAAWIYPTDTSGDRWILGNTGPGGAGTLSLGLRNGRANFSFWDNGIDGLQTVPPNQWTHLAWTYDLQGGQMAIYVNGRLDKSGTGHPNTLGDLDLVVGWLIAVGDGSYFHGRIDDLAIYCQTLAPNQIAALASDSVKPNQLLPSPDLPLPLANGCVWSVREIYAHPSGPNDLTSAEYIAHTAGLGTSTNYQSDVINFNDPDTNGDDSGFIGGDRPYRSNNRTPDGLGNRDDDYFVLAARTMLVISEEDDYTFGFSSDDGARLRVKGAVFRSSTDLNGDNPANPPHRGDTLAFPGNTGNSQTLGVTRLTPGAYEIEFLTWEVGGGAFCEVFFARGAKTAFDSSFQLLGYAGPSTLTATVTPFVQFITNGTLRPVRFTAQAGGYGANSYQWLFNGADASAGNVSGANSPTLTITAATAGNAGTYSVRVANHLGSVESGPALLILRDTAAPDHQKPTLTLTTPAPASLRVLSNSIRLAGTASDNVALQGVYVAIGNGPYKPATGLSNWSLTLPLEPGTNVFRIVAVDEAGNVSTPQTRTVFYAVSDLLTVTFAPGGSVAPNLNHKLLEVGRSYSMRAIAAKGYVFSNWTGGVLCSGPVINFPMSPGLALRANFVPNPFPARAGSYNGLFHETAAVRHERSGFVTAKVNASGGYSGSVTIEGRKLRFSGRFDLSGHATNILRRTGASALRLELEFDPNDPPQLHGRLSDGQWIANLIADLTPKVPRGTAVPLAGKYTFALPQINAVSGAPKGCSVGAISVGANSRVSILTKLADGTTASQSVPMPTNGPIPFYLPLYKGKGSALGWLYLARTTGTVSAVGGNVNWFRPAAPDDGQFAAGFEVELGAFGSVYHPPAASVRALPYTNATVSLELAPGFDELIRLESGGKVTDLGTNALKMSLTTANGLYSGTAIDPVSRRQITFAGAVLQGYDQGAGWLVATNESGRTSLSRAFSLIHEYRLNGTLTDELGGPSLVSSTGNPGLSGYTFNEGDDLSLSGGLTNTNNYSIEMLFSIDDTGGYRRFIDFKDFGSDEGLYSHNGVLVFHNFVGAPRPSVSPGQRLHLVLTRDSATSRVTAYVNGVQQLSFLDDDDAGVFSGPNGIIHFLIDDGGEHPSGFLDYIRIYDGPLSSFKVGAIHDASSP